MIVPDDAPADVVRWLAFGERGSSSEAIVSHLTGIPTRGGNSPFSYPHDPDDLRRCVLLLDACPSLAARFDEMRSAGRVWAALVDAWPDLTATLKEEMAAGNRAPRTWALMHRAIKRGRR